jgi:hypothetical protein
MSDIKQELNEPCEAELDLARSFPELFEFLSGHPANRPRSPEIWSRVLHNARQSQPILADLQARGLDLIFLNQYTPPGIDRRILYHTLVDWLARVQDPLTLSICLGVFLEPGARSCIKK